MCSVSLKVIACLTVMLALTTARADEKSLRICSDPNNLPFSNDKLEGFENKIAQIIANDLGRKIEYSWRAQRRGFFRESLKNGNCDIVMGAPAHFELCLTTQPYYRSTYVFVSRNDRASDIRSLDDERLAKLKIGIQVGIEGGTPPAIALTRRGLVQNLVGYSLCGDFAQPNPPSQIVDAVARGDVDLAIAWGPMAGYFARQQKLKMSPLAEQRDGDLRMAYDISIGVRKTEPELRDRINGILIARRTEIDRILDEYGVPRVAAEPKQAEAQVK